MKLSALAVDVPHNRAGASGDPEVLAVTHDSRAAAPGSLFAAFPGRKADGRCYVADAVARGAVAALGLAPAPAAASVPYLEVENPRRSAGLMAALLAGRPSEKLVMAGVTGTSGKTTTTYLLEGLLAGRHAKRGFFGTIVYRGAGGEAAAIASPHTTPEATELQPMLQALATDGGTAAILECSSHALVLERLAGCTFDVAVFLNLSREHLDFHKDMDDYFEAKARLFGLLKPNGKAVVNLGDGYGMKLATRLDADRIVGFFLEGEEGAEQTRPAALAGAVAVAAAAAGETGLFATVVGRAKLGIAGTHLDIEVSFSFSSSSPFKEENTVSETPLKLQKSDQSKTLLTVDSPLLGRPNAENLLAAAAAGFALGLSPAEISKGLGAVTSIPGRLEVVPNALGLTVLVDYAHKPAALEGVLKTVRTIAAARGGRVIAVFGCGGDRDRGKRPEMGRIAALLADEVVVTSDNPRSEEPEAILRDVRAGVEAAGGTARYVADRREA
ncbi:MAG: UDP-N-acetylmuramoyl-L-alanyl-D-glutamate--2,6-diaminopimelate ligase, partial [Thermoanaerobaculia bacterium]|nr:UDP-N-acetylmuramoyl-L-alanyl-D-glutamate--2,6-diaminopimelate ligase [Thermoanaerobaculia bacterium]